MSGFSSPQPKAEYLEELMAGYVLDALSMSETAEFESYLQADPQIAQQLADMQQVMGLIAYSAPSLQAPTDLWEKILAATETTETTQTAETKATPFVPSSFFSRISWPKVAIIGGAIALLGMGIDNLLLRQRLTLMEAAVHQSEVETRGFALQGTQAVSHASGSVVLDLESGKAVIALHQLPALPPGQTYSLWAITQHKKVFCGKFNTNASGHLIQEVPIPIKEYDSTVVAMEISRESANSPHSPRQSTLVMVSKS